MNWLKQLRQSKTYGVLMPIFGWLFLATTWPGLMYLMLSTKYGVIAFTTTVCVFVGVCAALFLVELSMMFISRRK